MFDESTLELEEQEVLWDKKQIAAYLGLKYRQLAERVIYRPGFPEPFTFGSSQSKRWRKVDIVEWAKPKPRRNK